jgi:hypothetical protein
MLPTSCVLRIPSLEGAIVGVLKITFGAPSTYCFILLRPRGALPIALAICLGMLQAACVATASWTNAGFNAAQMNHTIAATILYLHQIVVVKIK